MRIILIVGVLILLLFFYWLGGLGGILIGAILAAAIVLRFLAFMGSLELRSAQAWVNLTIVACIVTLLLRMTPGGGLGQTISAQFTSWTTGGGEAHVFRQEIEVTSGEEYRYKFNVPYLRYAFDLEGMEVPVQARLLTGDVFTYEPRGEDVLIRYADGRNVADFREFFSWEPPGDVIFIKSTGRPTRVVVVIRATN